MPAIVQANMGTGEVSVNGVPLSSIPVDEQNVVSDAYGRVGEMLSMADPNLTVAQPAIFDAHSVSAQDAMNTLGAQARVETTVQPVTAEKLGL